MLIRHITKEHYVVVSLIPGHTECSQGIMRSNIGTCGGTDLGDTDVAAQNNKRRTSSSAYCTVWWAIVDSNHRPRSYQDRALTY